MKQTHYSWLDLTRFIAAFMVLCSHLRGNAFVEYGLLPTEQQNPLNFVFFSITRLGHEAVLAFFVLSGFLVGGQVIRRLKEGTFDVKSYTIDRSVRILLPLICALLLIVVVNLTMGDSINFFQLIGNLFSLQGIFVSSATAPLWSLAYEVWFYVLIGCLAVLINRKRTIQYNTIQYNTIQYNTIQYNTIQYNTIQISNYLIIFVVFLIFTKLETVYLFVWIFGALSIMFVPQKNRLVLLSSIFLGVISIALLQVTAESRSMQIGFLSYLPSRNVIRLIFALFMSIMIQQLLLFEPKNKLAIKIDRAGTHLAKFSYTLYLTHYPLMALLTYFGFPKSEQVNIVSVGFYLLQILICLTVAYMLYLCFEKHTFAVKQYIKKLV
jgi:peptidoglycan/LPS O-acetylase OafA/YrhL